MTIHRRLRLRGHEPWQRELAVLWLAQASTALGFSFFFPFIPLFIQDLGISDTGQAALWSGIAGGVGGLFMMLTGPVWGILGDRYGLKKNVLRAMFGTALIIGLTGLVTDVYQLVAARMLLGMVSGSWVAVMALASAKVPRDKVPYAIGIVQSASFLGFTAGPLVGGVLADTLGFRATFMITGLLSAVSALLVLFLVKEAVRKSEPGAQAEKLGLHLMFGNFANILRYPGVAPVMLLLLLVQLGPAMMMPTLPLLISILPGIESAASSAGVAFSIMGLTGAASSMVVGKLTKRFGMSHVLIVAFIGGGLLYLPFLIIDNVIYVYGLVALLGLFNGGLNTLSYALVGTTVPVEKQGVAYGVSQSATALAWGGGPLIGGGVAAVFGLRQVFLLNAFALLISAALVARLLGQGTTEPDKKATDSETESVAGSDVIPVD